MAPPAFGRYEVVRELGAGGMGVVYLARDPATRRTVALKVLPHTLLADPDFRARFRREAQTVAALEHSCIVPLYDFGESDGEPYLVFRYLPGGSLADRLRQRGKLPLDEVQRIAARVARALDHAHRTGVVHRDIKPANVMFDDEGEAYLTDFGVARLPEASTALTRPAALIGTVSYMSPEQCEGKPATPASDIYALGCTLYEALTGRPPFVADNPMAIMLAHVRDPVPRAPGIDAGVADALQRAMAKEPGERYGDAAEAVEALGKRGDGADRPHVVASAPGGREPADGPPAAVAAETLVHGSDRANVPASPLRGPGAAGGAETVEVQRAPARRPRESGARAPDGIATAPQDTPTVPDRPRSRGATTTVPGGRVTPLEAPAAPDRTPPVGNCPGSGNAARAPSSRRMVPTGVLIACFLALGAVAAGVVLAAPWRDNGDGRATAPGGGLATGSPTRPTLSGLTVTPGVVPDVRGQAVTVAALAIQEAGFVARENHKKDVAPRGQVIDQSSAGTSLPLGSTIIIVVSDGP